jgi:hypothetical protein
MKKEKIMSDRPNNADSEIKIGDQSIYGFNKIDTKWFEDPSRIHYICMTMPPRPGCQLFCSILEYKFYPPTTDKNKLFILQVMKWEEMVYTVISIPIKDKAYAEAVAKTCGMRIANGVPTLLSQDKPKFFPINVDNAFTIENDPEHPIYKSPQHSQAFLQVEAQLCEFIYRGGGHAVEETLEKMKRA